MCVLNPQSELFSVWEKEKHISKFFFLQSLKLRWVLQQLWQKYQIYIYKMTEFFFVKAFMTFFENFKVNVQKNYIKKKFLALSIQHHHKYSSISILTYAQWIISIFFSYPTQLISQRRSIPFRCERGCPKKKLFLVLWMKLMLEKIRENHKKNVEK